MENELDLLRRALEEISKLQDPDPVLRCLKESLSKKIEILLDKLAKSDNT